MVREQVLVLVQERVQGLLQLGLGQAREQALVLERVPGQQLAAQLVPQQELEQQVHRHNPQRR